MTITCTVCGTVNPEGTTYCEGCGVELSAQSMSTQSLSAQSAAAPAVLPDPAAPAVSVPAGEQGATTTDTFTTDPAASDPGTGAAPSTDSPAFTDHAPDETVSHQPATDLAMADPTMTNRATDLPVSGAPVAGDPVTDGTAPESLPAGQADAAPQAAVSSPVPDASDTALAAAPTPAPSAAPAKLGIKKYGAPTGEFIPLHGDRLVVGRFDASSGPVDIDLSGLGGQEHISRRHAELYREGGAWMVRDLGSTNGVYLKAGGQSAFSPRLQEPAALRDGDEIAFGNLMLTFHQE